MFEGAPAAFGDRGLEDHIELLFRDDKMTLVVVEALRNAAASGQGLIEFRQQSLEMPRIVLRRDRVVESRRLLIEREFPAAKHIDSRAHSRNLLFQEVQPLSLDVHERPPVDFVEPARQFSSPGL